MVCQSHSTVKRREVKDDGIRGESLIHGLRVRTLSTVQSAYPPDISLIDSTTFQPVNGRLYTKPLWAGVYDYGYSSENTAIDSKSIFSTRFFYVCGIDLDFFGFA